MTHGTDHITLTLRDEAATRALGASLARALAPGLKVYLTGDLGAGKTTLVRALLRECGYEGKVKSPTYTWVEPYAVLNLDLYHFDLYRMAGPEEWAMSGFRELIDSTAVGVVEWPERAQGALPEPDITIELDIAPDPDTAIDPETAAPTRVAHLRAHGERGLAWLHTLQASWLTSHAS